MSDVLVLVAELVRGRSVDGDERALARRAASLLEGAGFVVATPSWQDGREQLGARAGSSRAPLTLTGHLDTVPADPSQWAVDPGRPSGTATEL